MMLMILAGCKKTDSTVGLDEKKQSLKSLLESSLDFMQKEAFTEAYDYLDSAKVISLEMEDSIGLSSVLNNYGLLNYKLGDYQNGLAFYRRSLEIDRQIGDSARIGRRLKNVGICYRQLGLYQRALDSYLESLGIAEVRVDSSEIASVNNSIGNLYNILDEFNRAEEHFRKSLIIWGDLADRNRSLIAKNNLANALLGQGLVSEAINIYEQVLVEKVKIGNRASVSISLNNLGEAYSRANLLSKARGAFVRSLDIRSSLGDSKGMAIVLNNLAELDLKEGNLESSKINIFRALSVSEELPSNEVELNSLRILKRVQRLDKNYFDALITDDRIDSINNRLFQVEKIEVLDRLNDYEKNLLQTQKDKALYEVNFQAQLNDQQRIVIRIIAFGLVIAAILIAFIIKGRLQQKKQNNELVDKNKTIQELNEKLEILLNDMKHRKSNDFNRLLGMVDLIVLKNPALKELLTPLNNVITTTYDLDDFLESDTRAVKLNFFDHLKALISRLEEKYDTKNRDIRVILECDEIVTNTKTATALSYVICELFTNSIKHASNHTNELLININLSVFQNEVLFRYRDNGEASDVEKKLELSNGFGWSILKKFIQSIGGQLEFARSNDQSVFSFKFEN